MSPAKLSALFAAAALLGCSGSVEVTPSTSSSGAGGGSSSSGGVAGGVPAPSCAEAPVIWSAPSGILWAAVAVSTDGSVYTYSYDGLLQKLSAGGALLWSASTPYDGAYRISAGGSHRLLIGPGSGVPAYRTYLDDGEVPHASWTLDAESIGQEPGIWGTRGVVSGDGQVVIAGAADNAFALSAFDDLQGLAWKAKSPAEGYGWALGAGPGSGVAGFSAGPNKLTRWGGGGEVMWSIDYDPQTVGVGDLAVAPSGDVYLLGVTEFPSEHPFSVGRVSAEGKPIFNAAIPSNADESTTCGIAPLPDGGAMVCVSFEHGIMGVQRYTAEGEGVWDPWAWFAPDCGALGSVLAVAPSPDGAVVVLTTTGLAKIAP